MKIYLVVGWDGTAMYEVPQPSAFLSISKATSRCQDLAIESDNENDEFEVRVYEVADAPLPTSSYPTEPYIAFRPCSPVKDITRDELTKAVEEAWRAWQKYKGEKYTPPVAESHDQDD